jgi:hypothetical protein
LSSDEIANSFLDIEGKFSNLSFKMSVFEVINIAIDCEIGGNYKQKKTEKKKKNINNIVPINNNEKNESETIINANNANKIENDKVYSNANFHLIFNNIFSFLTAIYPQEFICMGNSQESGNNQPKENKSEKVIHKLCNKHGDYFDWNYEAENIDYADKNEEEENNKYVMNIENSGNVNEIIHENEEAKLKNLKVLVNKIIPKMLENFINFSSSNSSFKLLKFIKVFMMNSNKELIRKAINPMLLSNVFSSNYFFLI